MSDRSYQVIARKWRPQRFDDVVGQEAVVRTLTNALDQGRTAHAYCFSGIRGVGKTTVARLLAKGLNCRSVQAPTSEPCGECDSCVEVMAGRSLDVIERDAASDRGINEMKELIEIARYSPSRDRYKVFILDEAHMLTPEASNALLKVLEEPPEWIVFVLATTEPNKILPTILSRCQHYQFGRISQRKIVGHLGRIAEAEGVEISDDALALLATAADGSLRDGQSLLDKLIAFAGEEVDEQTVTDLLGLVDRVLLFRATELIADGDIAGTLRFVDEMVDNGVDLHQFTVDLLGHVRNLLVVATVREAGSILHLPEGDIARLEEQAGRFSVDDLDRAFTVLAGNEYRIKMTEQPRYHLEVVLARLARMPSLEPIEELLADVRGGGGGSHGSDGGGGKRSRTAAAGGRAPSSARSPAAADRASSSEEDPRPEDRADDRREEPTTPETSEGTSSERETPRPKTREPQAASQASCESRPTPETETTSEPKETAETPEATIETPETAAEAPEEPRAAESTGTPAESTGAPAEPAAATPTRPEPPPGAAERPARNASDSLPMPALLRKVQEQLNASHPLVAQILGRASGISLAGERVVFQFPESAGLFVDRLRDPEMLQKLADATRAVTGREVLARVETVAGGVSLASSPSEHAEGGGSGPRPSEPASHAPAGDRPDPPPGPRGDGSAPASTTPPEVSSNGGSGRSPDAPPQDKDVPEARPSGVPAEARAGREPASPEAAAALRRRVEQEPLVQEFVKALRGQIISVEEI